MAGFDSNFSGIAIFSRLLQHFYGKIDYNLVMRKKIIIILSAFSICVGLSFVFFYYQASQKNIISPVGSGNLEPVEKPLDKYAFEALRKRVFAGSDITFEKVLKDEPTFTSCLFFFTSDGKRISGLANIPKKAGKYPVIVQLRGYIDQTIYETGAGTAHSGEVFAQNGFITLSPDFLGYGQSASPSADSIEERFETYTTALNLLASIKNLNSAFSSLNSENKIEANTDKIGIWGHSNGGHIALSVLEITGGTYPTILWNPVSKPFPYSILYYTDESEDHGKALRKMLADFEKDYDIEKYSPFNYFAWINAPIQLHQAEADEAVPLKWSEQLYIRLQQLEKNVTYYTYPGDNHDFNRGNWNTVVARNIAFYKKQFAK